MPTRTKVKANSTIFQRLDAFCADRDEPMRNEGKRRFIASEEIHRQFIVDACSVRPLALSPSLAIHQFDYDSRTYFFTSGFDTLEVPPGLIEEELNGSFLTVFLAETEIRSSATPLEIRQVVEVGDMDDTTYIGHDYLYIASLFPAIRCFSVEQLDSTESENILLLFCLGDRRRSEHWINDDLALAIAKLTTVSASAIPFTSLCRAVLDTEPASLFLSLYRCLEGLYARERTTNLMAALGVNKPWIETAQLLETHLGWYPREGLSLELLLGNADATNLEAIVNSFGEIIAGDAKPATVATRHIYGLRNSLVHYRPFHQVKSLKDPDWARLCEAMTYLIVKVS